MDQTHGTSVILGRYSALIPLKNEKRKKKYTFHPI